MPDMTEGTLDILTNLILISVLWEKYYYIPIIQMKKLSLREVN